MIYYWRQLPTWCLGAMVLETRDFQATALLGSNGDASAPRFSLKALSWGPLPPRSSVEKTSILYLALVAFVNVGSLLRGFAIENSPLSLSQALHLFATACLMVSVCRCFVGMVGCFCYGSVKLPLCIVSVLFLFGICCCMLLFYSVYIHMSDDSLACGFSGKNNHLL